MPLYNKVSVVERAIVSVLRQSHENWRLIVVNDGSTDGSAEHVARTFTDGRVRVIHQENSGPGAARNRGLRDATAPLVAFLDADDEWMPTFLELAVQALNENPACAGVAAGLLKGTERRVTLLEELPGVAAGHWRCPTSLPPADLKRAVDAFTPSSFVGRTAVLRELGGFYDRHHCTYAEDSYLWTRLVMRYPVYVLDRALVWIHTEDSDLGPGRMTPYPVPPLLSDIAAAKSGCPGSHAELLERFLDWYTVWVANRLAYQGEGKQALRLLRQLRPSIADEETAALLRRARLRAYAWPAVRIRYQLMRK